MEENNDLMFHYISENKWKFKVLGVGFIIIVLALIAALIFDNTMPVWGICVAVFVMVGFVGTSIYHYMRYKKWENENNKE